MIRLPALLLVSLLALSATASHLRAADPAPAQKKVVTDCDTPGDVRMLFPGGLKKALTFSWDDGRVYDYQLVETMDKYGLRGTFHLCSGLLDKEGYVKSADVKALYAKHEVASHTVTHCNLPLASDEEIRHQVVDDQKALQALVGYPIRGLAYPGGERSDRVDAILPKYGIVYARVVGTHNWFSLPKHRLSWAMTCNPGGVIPNAKRFLEWGTYPCLMAVWGHSYEIGEGNAWGTIDEIGKTLGGNKDVWYATNIEILDYQDAVEALQFSADGKTVKNPGKVPVWISIKDKPLKIEPGKTASLPV